MNERIQVSGVATEEKIKMLGPFAFGTVNTISSFDGKTVSRKVHLFGIVTFFGSVQVMWSGEKL